MDQNYRLSMYINTDLLRHAFSTANTMDWYPQFHGFMERFFRQLNTYWGCTGNMDIDPEYQGSRVNIVIDCHEFLVPSIDRCLDNILRDPINPEVYDLGGAPRATGGYREQAAAIQPLMPRINMEDMRTTIPGIPEDFIDEFAEEEKSLSNRKRKIVLT